MKVKLTSRHYGVHATVSEAEIRGAFADYATPAEPGNEHRDEWVINENLLLSRLPAAFLPLPPGRILLGVEDEDGGTAHSGCTRFRPWAKYFDAYMLWLVRPGEDRPDAT